MDKLPPPSVTESMQDTLPDTAPEATIVVPASAKLAEHDLLIIKWVGLSGPGTVTTFPLPIGEAAAGKPFSYVVKARYIAANAGLTVNVSYEVVRAATQLHEPSAIYVLRIVSGEVTEPLTIDTTPKTLLLKEQFSRDASDGHPPYAYRSSAPGVVEVIHPEKSTIVARTVGKADIEAKDASGARVGYRVDVIKGVHDFADDPAQSIADNSTVTLDEILLELQGLNVTARLTGDVLLLDAPKSGVRHASLIVSFVHEPGPVSSIDIDFTNVSGRYVSSNSVDWNKSDGSFHQISIPFGDSTVSVDDPSHCSFMLQAGTGNNIAHMEVRRIVVRR